MSLITRFQQAWTMAKQQPDIFGDRSQGMLAGLMQGSQPPKRGSKELMQMYKRLPWMRAVNSKISFSVASVTWELYIQRGGAGQGQAIRNQKLQKADARYRQKSIKSLKAVGEVQEILDHPFLALLDNANPAMTGRVARQVTQTHLDIKGEAFWILERNGTGMPIEYWPVPPHWVLDTPSVKRPTFRVAWGSWRGEIPETEIVWIKDADPENPYGRGTGIAEALTDELETDEYSAKYVKSWFYNNATPDLLVGVEGADESELKRAKQKWEDQHRGFWRAFRSHWHSGKMNVEQLGYNFQQQQLIRLREFERDIILQTYGVSPEILGITDSSNRATAQAASFIFANWVLVPRLELLRSEMQEKLVPQFDDRLILDYVSPVPADQDFELQVAEKVPWSRTLNEWRDLQGLPLDDEGDYYRVPRGQDPEQQGQPPKEPPDLMMLGATAVKDEAAAVKDEVKTPRKEDVISILKNLDPQHLTNTLDPEMQNLIKDWGEDIFDELGIDPAFNIHNPIVNEHLLHLRTNKIKGMTDTTYKALQKTLSQGVEAGEGIPSLAKRVSETFDVAKTTRAKTIARTEVIGSSNFATTEAHRQSGIVTTRGWLATRDGREREMHGDMNGQERAINQPFTARDGYTAMHPGDFGQPHHDINCRCTTVAIIKDPKGKWLSEEEQSKRWKAFDEKAERWEGRIERAAKKGFQAQQNAIMEALNALSE